MALQSFFYFKNDELPLIPLVPLIRQSVSYNPSAAAQHFTRHLRNGTGSIAVAMRADGNPPPERALATKKHRISTKHAFNACSGFLCTLAT